MNDTELLKAVLDNGGDAVGIQDRFGDNSELYARCCRNFISSQYVVQLQNAINDKRYSEAFAFAHPLKGLSGNLGLTEYYTAICELVEALRAEDYSNIEALYLRVEHEFENVKRICSGEKAKPFVTETSPHNLKEADEKNKLQKKAIAEKRRFIRNSAVFILAVLVLSLGAFTLIGGAFREKTRVESGHHLLETGNQIGMYLSEMVDNDWRIASSVANGIVHSNYKDFNDAYITIMQEQQQAWGVTGLVLYTENGFSIDAERKTETNGVASQTIAQAHRNGRALSIIASQIIYTLPIETEQTLYGSRIVAVSLVRDMDTFLDNMDISSFNNEAWIYLTDANGIIFSIRSGREIAFSFNIGTIIGKYTLLPLAEEPESHGAFSDSASAFYMTNKMGDMYLVSIPVAVSDATTINMRVFYIVPEYAVNKSSNDFAKNLTIFSVFIIVVLVCLASAAFFAVYRNKKRSFDAELSTRERMFDLLIGNIRTVFGLFRINQTEPAYISSNAAAMLDDSHWSLQRTENVYSIHSGSGVDTRMLQELNEKLGLWDGKGVFSSGYLQSNNSVPPAYFEFTLYPVDELGESLVGIVQDVTAVHDREEATINAMEMAKRSNEAKTRFLANMSHDIRTPMNAIMNMSRFAIESAYEPKKHAEYLKIIYESSEHLLHLINDVLDMSRIESGQMVIASEPFNIRAVLQAHLESIGTLCKANKQIFIVDLSGICVDAVLGDSLKLLQIVTNLLSNAIKFTPHGGAVRFIAAEIPSLRNDIVNIRITVEDNGVGISTSSISHIFEPFYRANDKHIGKIEGTGLGLSIVKSYVDAMGGTITCESEEGEGTTFTVELVFPKAKIEENVFNGVDLQSSKLFAGMRCLVVEDIDTNQIIARTLLERLGFKVDIASEGKEGANKFIRSNPGTYDVIYMDIQMPIFDGYQSTVLIRQSEHPQAKQIPIIAMSANVFVEDIEKARIAGMDGYIGKPIVSIELVEQTLKAIRTKKGKTS